jgi:two-component system CAI-1 autoinducer sensor kinase/phosphatase CqsS
MLSPNGSNSPLARAPVVLRWARDLARWVYRSFERSVQYSGPRFAAVGVFGVIGFPLYYWVWHDLFPQPYENLPMRLIGSAICLPLAISHRWPQMLRAWLPLYWYFALLYSLPFFFTYMLLMNHMSQVWSMSTLIAIFLMILLLDWLNLVLMFIAGSALAWLAYVLSAPVGDVNSIFAENMAIFLFAIVAGGIFNLSAEMVTQEKLNALLGAASNIAHELRTPLLGMKAGAAGLRRYIPSLIDGYKRAREAGLPVGHIRAAHMDSLESVLERIETEANYSNVIIDMLLFNARQSAINVEEFRVCSVQHCIRVALARYPFVSPEQRDLVVTDESCDFEFRGAEILLVHILFNLLKNGLYHIGRAGKGDIRIWTDQQRRLHVRDSGAGIPAQVLPRIFRRFYIWSPAGATPPGAGLGLAFCKMVIESFGGTITCDSAYGEYTEFVLTFPAVEP